jgi:L-asparaginase II
MTEQIAPAPPALALVRRGPVTEIVHRGIAAVCRPDGTVLEAWGDPGRVILPRSAAKMLQALPLVESGAADAFGLDERRLALACASHQGTETHLALVRGWLADLGLSDDAFRCGAHAPLDKGSRIAMRQKGERPTQAHNQCSGKHAGFLTLARHLGAGPDYVETGHPVQTAVRTAIEEVSGEPSAGVAVDGCSAPNFALSLRGFATAMARFARPREAFSGVRSEAAERLRGAMAAHPDLVGGEGTSTTGLMRACGRGVAVKSGAAGVFAAMLPEQGLGIALKMEDGSEEGRDAAIAALLVRAGALDRAHPLYAELADAPLLNWRGIDCGRRFAAPDLLP